MLDLDLTPLRSRPSLELEVTRELAETELGVYHQSYKQPGVPVTLKKLRDTHHTLARALASGMTTVEASAFTGRSKTSIGLLLKDPTFIELVASYRSTQSAMEADFHAKLRAVGLDAIDELQDRLDEDPDKFSQKELMDLVQLTADRTGHGPHTKSTQLNVNVDLATRLENARRRLESQSDA